MKNHVCVLILLMASRLFAEDELAKFDLTAAEQFAGLALGCIHKEYPNRLHIHSTAMQMLNRRAN